jgi:predicted dehydrogenase
MEKIGIIMNGVTGRMGTRQHLERSIIAIRNQGGLQLSNGKSVMPEPILVGRNEEKLRVLAQNYNISRFSTDLEECLKDPFYQIYFDSQTTLRRANDVRKAIAYGKHIYCEKPTAVNSKEAFELACLAEEKSVKNGVVQDKLFLPGLLKLERLIDSGFFGRILSIRGEFGYWVFEGDWQRAQRPSWNYRKEDGGGIIVDMLCHWRYVLANLFGDIKALSCYGKTHIEKRTDEEGHPYRATADDAAYSTFELEGGIIAHINSSWNVRVNRDELFELQVDGTEGSAVAGLRNCKIQHRVNTPKAVWNPDIEDQNNYREQWMNVPMNEGTDNAFKIQWEMFLKHVIADEPYKYNLLEGAKGVQLAELGLKSWNERRWINIPELKLQEASERSTESV